MVTKEKLQKYTDREPLAYHSIVITCACGGEFVSGSTQEVVRVDICSNCHPFFTGEKRLVDSQGRVEKFLKKYQKAAKD